MPVSYALVLFVILIATLSVLRSALVYELSGTSLLLFGSTKPGIIVYTIIFLPGTIIHELSHWIVAEVLQVRTGAITIFPDLDGRDEGSSERLGSVSTAPSDPFRAFLIGLSPFLTGLGILAVLGHLLSIGWGIFPPWQLALIAYGIMVIGNSMMISKSDRRTWPVILFFLALIIIVLIRMKANLPPSFYSLTSSVLSSLNIILGVTAGLNLVMIVGSYGLRRLIEKITKRRIV